MLRSTTPLRLTSLALIVGVLLGAPRVEAQTVYGSDSAGALTWELTMPPGGPCLAPTPFAFPCPYAFLFCPGVPAPVAPPPGSLWGDIADDAFTDRVYVTDGRVIVVHGGDAPCIAFGGACLPLDAFPVPTTTPAMGPITGMGCDGSGTLTGGAPLLWITDGTSLAGIVPPLLATCTPATVMFGPCLLPTPLVPVTDVSWDPGTGMLWAISAAGLVQPILTPGCGPGAPAVAVAACGTVAPFTGLAYDTTTPDLFGSPPAAYVTDGAIIARIDLTTGLPATPTFAAPVPCSPTPAPFTGLAHALHGGTYGSNRVSAHLGTYGQSTSPSTTFGLEVTGAPIFVPAWLIAKFNVPGPGIFCPAVPGLGTMFWVDPSPPSTLIGFGAIPPGGVCHFYGAALPPGIPPGAEIYAQMIFWAPGSAVAADATEAVAVTIGLP